MAKRVSCCCIPRVSDDELEEYVLSDISRLRQIIKQEKEQAESRQPSASSNTNIYSGEGGLETDGIGSQSLPPPPSSLLNSSTGDALDAADTQSMFFVEDLLSNDSASVVNYITPIPEGLEDDEEEDIHPIIQLQMAQREFESKSNHSADQDRAFSVKANMKTKGSMALIGKMMFGLVQQTVPLCGECAEYAVLKSGISQLRRAAGDYEILTMMFGLRLCPSCTEGIRLKEKFSNKITSKWLSSIYDSIIHVPMSPKNRERAHKFLRWVKELRDLKRMTPFLEESDSFISVEVSETRVPREDATRVNKDALFYLISQILYHDENRAIALC